MLIPLESCGSISYSRSFARPLESFFLPYPSYSPLFMGGTVPLFRDGTVPLIMGYTVPLFIGGTVPLFIGGAVPLFLGVTIPRDNPSLHRRHNLADVHVCKMGGHSLSPFTP